MVDALVAAVVVVIFDVIPNALSQARHVVLMVRKNGSIIPLSHKLTRNKRKNDRLLKKNVSLRFECKW